MYGAPMPAPVFLIGGGREPEGVVASHRPFVDACGPGPLLCVVLEEDGEEPDLDRWTGALESAGAGDVRPLVVSPSRRPSAGELEGVAGVYVAGGWTPGYPEALCGGGVAAAPGGRPPAGVSAGGPGPPAA